MSRLPMVFQQWYQTQWSSSEEANDRFLYLKAALAGLFLLNILDGVFTTYWLSTAQAVEANPLMAFAAMSSLNQQVQNPMAGLLGAMGGGGSAQQVGKDLRC